MRLSLSVMGRKIIYNISIAHTHGNRDFTSRISRTWEPYTSWCLKQVQIDVLTLAQVQKVVSQGTNEALSWEFTPSQIVQEKGIALWKPFYLDTFSLKNMKSRSWIMLQESSWACSNGRSLRKQCIRYAQTTFCPTCAFSWAAWSRCWSPGAVPPNLCTQPPFTIKKGITRAWKGAGSH